MARSRIRNSWPGATDEAQKSTGVGGGSYYQVEEPPLVRDKKDIVRNLEDITEWAARELRRIQDTILTGLEDSMCISAYDAEPARASESNIHGGILQLVTAGAVSSGASLVVTQGIGKMFFVVNTALDSSGVIKIKGQVVDRNTGVEATGTSTVTISGLTTDASALDVSGNTVHSFSNAYITNKWFHGTVSVSVSIAVDIQDIDVYHCSFEQFNDSENFWLTTFDVNLLATHANGKFHSYLYTTKPNGSTLEITAVAAFNLVSPIAGRYYRLRRGNLDIAMDGSKDGVFVDVHYTNSPAYIEDMSMKVWAMRELA